MGGREKREVSSYFPSSTSWEELLGHDRTVRAGGGPNSLSRPCACYRNCNDRTMPVVVYSLLRPFSIL